MAKTVLRSVSPVLSLEKTTLERGLDGVVPWVAETRRAGFAAYEKAAMPSGKEEAWRYVELDFDLADLALPGAAGERLAVSPYLSAIESFSGWATVVDGYVTIDDVTDESAAFERLADLSPSLGTSLEGVVGLLADDDIFASAHRAFFQDGVVLHVPRNVTVGMPYVIDVQATQAGTVSFPHVTLVLEDNAEASVIVVYRSADGSIVACPQIEAKVGDGARLKLTTIQAWGPETSGIGFQRVALGRDASLKFGEVGLGGSLGRLDLGVDLIGDGSHSEMVGIYFGDGDQVLDYRVVVNHHGKNTSSDVFLKGAVEDQAESVFTGLLKIWPDATNTSTFEQNRNLVLSDGAKAHSVPNLEILCDDVVCGHGSTVGPLEAEHLYYLQSRGLSQDRAERVLLRGFFQEIIDRLPAPQVAEPVTTAVHSKFVLAQREGRI